MKYHGPRFPGGVAHAFKVLERALPLLGDGTAVERREVSVTTSFTGPGARDAFEMVSRAVTGGRYVVDRALARPERGRTLERRRSGSPVLKGEMAARLLARPAVDVYDVADLT